MAITTTVRPTFANGPSAGRFRKTAAVFPGFATTGLPPTCGRPSVPVTWVPLDPDRSGAVESERRGIDPGGPGGSATDPGGGGGGAARIDTGGMDCERWPGMGKGGAAPPLTGRGGGGGEAGECGQRGEGGSGGRPPRKREGAGAVERRMRAAGVERRTAAARLERRTTGAGAAGAPPYTPGEDTAPR